jgi:NitT/TauT family transport system substrate-binding protein
MITKTESLVKYLIVCFLFAASMSHAETVVLSVPGPGSLVYLPVQLAKAIGADQTEGIELKLRFFSGGPLALRDLNENNSDFSVVGLPAIASARADHMPLLAIGQLSQSAMVTLMIRNDLKRKIHNVAQLKDKRIGVNTSTRTARSTSQMLTEYVLRRAGLKPSEVQIIPAGQSREAQRSALLSNTVDAMMGDEPFATELVKKGEATILVNLYNPTQSSQLLGGPFVHAALATREDVFAKYPATVKKVQRMFDQTLSWISHHSVTELVEKLASQPGFDEANKDLLTEVLQNNPGMYPEQIIWNANAVTTTEKFFLSMAGNEAESNIKFSQFIKNSSAPQ